MPVRLHRSNSLRIAWVLKGKTALSLHLLQLIQCLEAAIGNPLI